MIRGHFRNASEVLFALAFVLLIITSTFVAYYGSIGLTDFVLSLVIILVMSLQVVIMMWQVSRESPRIMVLPKINVFLASAHFDLYQELTVKSARIRVGLRSYKFSIKRYNNIPAVTAQAQFDVGNSGLRDVTVHECRVYLEVPDEKEICTPLIFCEEDDLVAAKRENRLPKRKRLTGGERVTKFFELAGNGVYRLDIYTTELECQRRLMYFRIGNQIAFCDMSRRVGEKTFHKIGEIVRRV
ncbi:MAG: hypothetical protein WCC94_08805 [Candidatus Bathyarchaeia archaeon]